MNRCWTRETTNQTSARTLVRARGPQLAGTPGRAEGTAAATYPSEPNPGVRLARRPGSARPAIPAQRAARAQTQDATASCDLARLRPASPNTAQESERPGGSSLLCPGHPQSHATSAHCVAAPSLQTPQELQGPRARRRRTKWACHQAPSDWRTQCTQPPTGGAASPPQECCPFSRKAPSPHFPSKALTCVSAQFSSRYTRPYPGTSRPEHAAWRDWPRSAPAAPNQLVPTGGAVPPPEAPNSLYSRRKEPSSRNFACTTSATPTGVPARGRTRAPTKRRPDSARRRGAAHSP